MAKGKGKGRGSALGKIVVDRDGLMEYLKKNVPKQVNCSTVVKLFWQYRNATKPKEK